MNQIFNFSRFIRYARYQVSMNRKSILLTIGGASVALFLLLLFFMLTTRHWQQHHWIPLFLISAAIGGLLFIGNSFGFLRKKESSLNTLMLPVSVQEKFIYEYTSKVILYTALFPILFYFISIPALTVAQFIKPNHIYVSFSFVPIFNPADKFLFKVAAYIYLFTSSLVFVGASVFKKYPLVKTLIFVGAIILIGFSYFYLAFEIFKIQNGMGYVVQKLIDSDDTGLIWLYWILSISASTALAYGFFKLKEKEVS